MLSPIQPNLRPSASSLLARVLSTPELAAQVQALPGALLAKLIAQIGLEDAGELIALASSAQLAEAFDEDLWRSSRPGEDPRFDSQRFLLWLEILGEAGESVVAARLAELSPDLVTLAFHRHLLVIPLDDLREELTADDDDDAQAAEKALENCLSEELDDYQLIWRGGDGWDSLLSALLALDRDHHALAAKLLERCASLSRRQLDEHGGLCEVLSAAETLEVDLGAERESRRAERGYVAPSAAAAFLRLALRPAAPDSSFRERDATTRAYFRELSRQSPTPTPKPTQRVDLVRLLAASGISENVAAPRRLQPASGPREPLVLAALRELLTRRPEKVAERSEELAYLSNVLLEGASVNGRPLRPAEAVEHVLTCVSLGLLIAAARQVPTAERAAELLTEQACDGLFRLALARAREPGLEMGHPSHEETLKRVRTLLKNLQV